MRLTHVIAIDFRYCWLKLKKSLKWGILSAILALLISPLIINQLNIEDSYRATATLYSFDEANESTTSLGVETIQRYSEMIKSRRIACEVAELLADPDLSADKIYDMLSTESRYLYTSTVRYNNDLTVIPVYADSANKAQSIAVANAAADAFALEINALLGIDVIKVLDYANTAETVEDKDSMQVLLSIAIAVLAGGLTIAWFVLRVIFSSRIQTMTDLSFYGQIPVLGVLPKEKKR